MTTIEHWSKQLESNDADAKRTAAEELSLCGEQACPAAVQLVRVCSDPDDETAEYAVAALEELGTPPVEHFEQLVQLVNDPQEQRAYWAVTLLGRLEAAAAGASNQLVKALEDHSSLAVRQRAAWALARVGTLDETARTALQTAAQSDDPRLARLAQEALST